MHIKRVLKSHFIDTNLVPAFLVILFFSPIAFQFLGNSLMDLAVRYIFYDDGFYYLKIADNLYTRGISSFDGIHSTNGYHPLWLFVSIILRSLSNIENFAMLTVILQTLIFSFTGFLLYKLSFVLHADRSCSDPLPMSFLLVPSVIVMANPLLILIVVNGLETSLSLFLLIGFFLSVFTIYYSKETSLIKHKSYHSHNKVLISLGFITSIGAVLTRLDYVIPVLFSLGALTIVRSIKSRKTDRVFLSMTISTISVIILYMLINKLLFDTFTPVSGFVKQEGLFYALFNLEWHGVAGAIASVFWPNVYFFWLGSFKFILIGITLSCIALVSAYLYTGPISFLWSIYLIILVIRKMLKKSLLKAYGRIINVSLIVMVISGGLAFNSVLDTFRPKHEWRYDRFAAAQWISDNLPPDTRLGTWWAGTLGYMAKQPVVNLDGLVNDIRFANILKQCELAKYLIAERIFYIADYFPVSPIKEGNKLVDEMFANRCWSKTMTDLETSGYIVEITRHWQDPNPSRNPNAGFYILKIKRSN